jgi:hypothetical protein
MAQKKDRKVKVTKEFTYKLDDVRSRTLPAGWKGDVPADIARKIEADKCGSIDKAAEKTAAEQDKADKDAADAAENRATDDPDGRAESAAATDAPDAAKSTSAGA